MDALSRAHRRTLLRTTLLGVLAAAAFVLLSVLLGSRPASAAEAVPTTPSATQPTSLTGLVSGLTHDVGTIADTVVHAVVPAAPASPVVAPAPAAPVAPAPATRPGGTTPSATPARPVSDPAPAPAAVPSHAAPAVATPAAPAVATPPAPAAPAPAAAAPSAPAAPPAPQAAASTQVVARTGLGGALAGTTDVVAGLTRQHLVGTTVDPLVSSLDGVLGRVPVVGPVVGPHTLGSVTAPVIGLLDDTLGSVGGVVAGVPVLVGTLPAPIGGVSGLVPTSPLPGETSVAGSRSGDAPATTPAAEAHQRSLPSSGPFVVAVSSASRPSTHTTASLRALPTVSSSAAPAPAGGPLDGPFAPLPTAPLPAAPAGSNGSGAGAGTAGGPAGAATPEHLGTIALAVGATSSAVDQALPASVVADHDVAPD